MTLTLPQAEVRFPRAQGFDARIDNLYVRAAPGGGVDLRVYTRDSLAERRDDEGSFYENVLDLGYVWARTQWHGGEGLDWDPPDRTGLQGDLALDLIRFWSSESLDVAPPGEGEPYTLNLSHKFQDWQGTVVTQIADMSASNEFLFIADGQLVSWYDSWTNTTAVDSVSVGVTIFSMVVAPNGSVMVGGGDGHLYYKRFDHSAFTDVFNPLVVGRPQVAGVWFTKGRFIVGLSNTSTAELLEVTPAADGLSVTEVIIDTAVGAFWSVVDSGPALVAACSDGTVRTYTPFLDSNDPSLVGQLIPRGRTQMPGDELPYLLGDIEGLLLILTFTGVNVVGGAEARAYSAEVLDARFDYSIGNRQLKRSWATTNESGLVLKEMVATRDELFFVISDIVDGVEEEFVWRFDAVTTGISKHRQSGPPNPVGLAVRPFLRFEDQIGGVTAFSDVFYDDPEFEDTGYIITPNITFGLNTPINWIAIMVEGRQLGNGATIEIYRSTDPEAITDKDDPSWALIRRLHSNQQTNIETVIANTTARHIALQVRITPTTDNLISAELTRVAIRGLPQHRDFMVDIPINISDLIEVPGRQPIRISGWGNVIHTALLDIVGNAIELEVFNPPLVLRGVVDNLLEPTPWISPRGSAGFRCILQFRGNRTTEAGAETAITGDSLTGLGLMGISTTGLGNAGPS